jgi:hypothetical protein
MQQILTVEKNCFKRWAEGRGGGSNFHHLETESLIFLVHFPFCGKYGYTALILQNFHDSMNVTPSETILLFFRLAPF